MAEHIRRKFRATGIRADDVTGLGITETDGKGRTIAIYSLYYPTKLSNKDMHDDICRVVRGLLDDGQQAMVNLGGLSAKYAWRKAHEPRIIVRGRQFDGRYDEVKELSEDAIERQTTIKEELGS